VTLGQLLTAVLSVIAPAGTPAVPSLNVNVVETVGGGGGGGDATAANQVLEISALNSILAKIIAAPSTEAKQDAIIAALGPLATEATVAAILAALAAPVLPAGAATEVTLAAILAAMGTPALPSGAATEATQLANEALLTSILSALGGTIAVSASALPLPLGAATEATLASILSALAGTIAVSMATLPVPTLTKGTQGATGFSVQPLRDAGRTSVVYRTGASLNQVGGFTSDTEYASGSIVKVTGAGVVGSAATSHVIPAGKTFRVQSLSIHMRVQTTSAVATVAEMGLLIEPSGTVTNASPLAMMVRVGGPATAGYSDHEVLTIPEGFDIVGDGTLAIGIYMRVNFASGSGPTVYAQITGYEF